MSGMALLRKVYLEPDRVRVRLNPPAVGQLLDQEQTPAAPVGSGAPNERRSVEPFPAIHHRHMDALRTDQDVETDSTSVRRRMAHSVRYQFTRKELDVGDRLSGQVLGQLSPHVPPSFADGEGACGEHVLEQGQITSSRAYPDDDQANRTLVVR
jgi:hypothetical protein